ncbi:MAG TPA: hypothetical protein VFA43_14710 [Gemmatimonadaceae bacterium]|nr:hypothetical protein [Gemmatimonadaceae bacterium]
MYESVRPDYRRIGIFCALGWFVGMTIMQLVTTHDSLILILSLNAVGAVFFGAVFALVMRRWMRRVMRELYDGTSPWMSPVPPGEYEARVMCSVMRGRIAVGGHLYVGRELWTFMPHTKNLRGHRDPMRWERPGRLVLSTEPIQSRWLTVILGSKTSDRLVVSLGGLRDQFVVPDAKLAVFELQKILSVSAQ